MEYTIEETIRIFNERKNITPFMTYVMDHIINPYLNNSRRSYSAQKRFPEANTEELKETMFTSLFIALKESDFFLTYTQKKGTLEAYLYSIVSRINAFEGIKKTKDKFNVLKKRIKQELEAGRKVFFFWLGNIKRRSQNYDEKTERKKFYHAKFGEIPPDLFEENDNKINSFPNVSNINLKYIQSEKLRTYLEKVLLQVEASFTLRQLTNIFWEQTFAVKENSLDAKMDHNLKTENQWEMESGIEDVSDEEKEIELFKSLNGQINSKLSGHLYWFAKAVQEIAKQEPDDKLSNKRVKKGTKKGGVYKKAAELSQGRTKRTTCEYQIEGAKNSFYNIFNTTYKKYFESAPEAYKQSILNDFLNIYVKQIENLENDSQ